MKIDSTSTEGRLTAALDELDATVATLQRLIDVERAEVDPDRLFGLVASLSTLAEKPAA